MRTYRVTLKVNGTLERVYPTLSSDPPLSAVQILNLLAGAEESAVASLHSGADASRRAGRHRRRDARRRAASPSRSGSSGRRQRLFGLNRFSIDPALVQRRRREPDRAPHRRQAHHARPLRAVLARPAAARGAACSRVEYTLSDRFSVLLTQRRARRPRLRPPPAPDRADAAARSGWRRSRSPPGGPPRAEPPLVTDVRVEADARTRSRLQPYLSFRPASRSTPRAVRAVGASCCYATGEFEDVRGRDGSRARGRRGGVPARARAAAGGAARRRETACSPRRSCAPSRGCARASRSGRRGWTRRRATSRSRSAARGYLEARVSRARRALGSAAAPRSSRSAPVRWRRWTTSPWRGRPASRSQLLRQLTSPHPRQAWRRARAREGGGCDAARAPGRRGHWRADGGGTARRTTPQAARVSCASRSLAGQRMELQLRGSRVPGEAAPRRGAHRCARAARATDALEEALDSLDAGAARARPPRGLGLARGRSRAPPGSRSCTSSSRARRSQVGSRPRGGRRRAALPCRSSAHARRRPAARRTVLERDVRCSAQRGARAGLHARRRRRARCRRAAGRCRCCSACAPVRARDVLRGRAARAPASRRSRRAAPARSASPTASRDLALDRRPSSLPSATQGLLAAEVSPRSLQSEDKGSAEVALPDHARRAHAHRARSCSRGLERTREDVVRARARAARRASPLAVASARGRAAAAGARDLRARRGRRARLRRRRARRSPRLRASQEAPRAAIAYGHRLRGARPAARQRRGHAAQPVRPGPQPVEPSRASASAAAGFLATYREPLPARASRTCSSPPSARRRTATASTSCATAALQTARALKPSSWNADRCATPTRRRTSST